MKQNKRALFIWGLISAFHVVLSPLMQGDERPGSKSAPGLLSDVQHSSTTVLIAAHRGGYQNDREDRAPENSVANIHHCERKGFQLYETDIQRTKDGHFVMVHDPTLDRETNGSGKVSDLTLSQVKSLRKRYRDGTLSEASIATLEEFLAQGKGRTVYKADLKPGVSQHFSEIMQIVDQNDAMGGIIFRVDYNEVDLFSAYKESEGSHYAEHLFMFKVKSKKQIDDIKARFQSTTIQINLRKKDPATEFVLELIRYATEKGFVVETHAEGNPNDWAKLIEAGVRIFHTKSPAKVKAFLDSH